MESSEIELTDEQKLVIQHPPGNHARILAVAGSGKTSTLAHYLVHLVDNQLAKPSSILILMYNKLARRQFQENLVELHGEEQLPGRVFTFHALGYKFHEQGVQNGWIPGPTDWWIGDKEERERLTVHGVLNLLESRGVLKPAEIDVDEAIDALHAWKASLIPPDRAGYGGNRHMPLVYREFEKIRKRERALTFDDFIPDAVRILETNASVLSSYSGKYDVIVIDEYQDINYAQHRFVSLLAGEKADIVVVGDDDQTIYEWRGARPSYIKEFDDKYSHKECSTYELTNSFRFGPQIADAAASCIANNKQRHPKTLKAYFEDKDSEFKVLLDKAEQPSESAKELAETAKSLIEDHGTDGKEIAVLGRLFAQLDPLEIFFLQYEIPYRVLGRKPFFQRAEVQSLLCYFRLAMDFNEDFVKRHSEMIVSTANKPSRMLPRKILESDLRKARSEGTSVRNAIEYVANNYKNGLKDFQRENMIDYLVVLRKLHKDIESSDGRNFGSLACDLVKKVDYLNQFKDYFGPGLPSQDRELTVAHFLQFASDTELPVGDFLHYVDSLDTTQGAPEHQQVLFTTIYRTKGLEFDYVMIPGCNEGSMPMLLDELVPVFDKEGLVPSEPLSPLIERERRLFYVGVTRARKAVFISAGAGRSAADSHGSSEVVEPSRFLYEAGLLVKDSNGEGGDH